MAELAVGYVVEVCTHERVYFTGFLWFTVGSGSGSGGSGSGSCGGCSGRGGGGSSSNKI